MKRLAGAIAPHVGALTAYLVIGLSAVGMYGALLPGLPDSGPVPLPCLPYLLPFYFGYLDPVIILVWLAACSTFFVPPIAAVALVDSSRRWWEGLFVVVAANAYAAVAIWGSRMIYFYERPYTTGAGIRVLIQSHFVILVLSVAGLVLGWLLRTKLSRKSGGPNAAP